MGTKEWKSFGVTELRQVPKTMGVYWIKTDKEDLYIGHSKNLCTRMSTHFRFFKVLLSKYGSNLVVLIYETDNPSLEEEKLIKEFNPTYNVHHNQRAKEKNFDLKYRSNQTWRDNKEKWGVKI